MIVVLADNPSLGATYRLREALAPLSKDGKVGVIVKQHDEWRWHDFGPDVVLTPNNFIAADEYAASVTQKARKLIEEADWLFMVGMTGYDVLEAIYGPGMRYSAPWPHIVLYHVESFYRGERARAFDAYESSIGVVKTFAMPDLWEQRRDTAVPLLQPMMVPPAPPAKTANLYIVHSPGTEKKAIAKGSDTIDRGVALATEKLGRDVDLWVGIDQPHAEVLRRKAIAHVCIDQVPPDDYPTGLGNSGCEGLALACVTMSRYKVDTGEYFAPPPIINVESATDIAYHLTAYWKLGTTMRDRQRRRSWAWAVGHLGVEAWRHYVWKHLPTVIRDRSRGHLDNFAAPLVR